LNPQPKLTTRHLISLIYTNHARYAVANTTNRYFKPVYKVDAEPPESVVGIRIDRVTRGARPDEKKYAAALT
jgi:hypothetical protein